jgi:hypothetical protein
MIYDDALAKFRQGQTNSVLVITSGPHTDQSLDGAGLQDYVRRTFEPARPVAINVIDFGGDPDRATWEAIAQISGGGYQKLSTSTSPDLTSAIIGDHQIPRLGQERKGPHVRILGETKPRCCGVDHRRRKRDRCGLRPRACRPRRTSGV